MYEWDEQKSEENRRKHGLSFGDAPKVFVGSCLSLEDTRFDYGEKRYLTFGFLGRQAGGDRPHAAQREHADHLDEKGEQP
ncbi:BrnT family toxin [Candidatus Palauibacter sp.]|uniref:BrnT family toxin n=1 Tax=Candidatus Palauibacter sp. TaxID=3101350 RepID=UPI003B515C83